MSQRQWGIAALIFANVLWGGSFVAAKYLLDELSTPMVALMRIAPGVPFMFVYGLWRGNRLRPTAPEAGGYFLLGFIGFGAAKMLQYAGLAQSTAIDGALLVSFEAILTMLAAIVFLGERATLRRAFSAVLGFAGVCIVSRINPLEGFGALANQRAMGNVVMVLSLACEAGYTCLAARLMRHDDPTRAMCWSLLFGTLVLAIPAAPHLAELTRISPFTWSMVLFLGIGPTALAYTIWLACAKFLDAGNMAITLYVQPLSGAMFAIALLGDQIHWGTIIGGVILLGAVQLASGGSDAPETG